MRNRILVTGNSGFIGKALVRRLRDQHLDVHTWSPDTLEGNEELGNLEKLLSRLNPQIIFHVGADSNTLETDVNYVMTWNFQATVLIASWARANAAKLIFSSSAANYGSSSGLPENLYAWSKYAAERYVSATGGVSLRYFNVYGPGEGQKGRMASYVYQSWLLNQRNEIPKLFPGFPKRDFVYVDDVVSANIHALGNYEALRSGVYDVGTGVARTFESCLEVFQIPFEYSTSESIPVGYQFHTQADPDKFLPGWEPKFSLELGLLAYKTFLEEEEKR